MSREDQRPWPQLGYRIGPPITEAEIARIFSNDPTYDAWGGDAYDAWRDDQLTAFWDLVNTIVPVESNLFVRLPGVAGLAERHDDIPF